MKNLFYLTSVLFVFILTSCSKDKKSETEDISGRWDLVEMKMEGTFTESGMTINFNGITRNIQGENYIILNEDGTATGQNSPFDIELEYEIMGQTTTVTIPVGNSLPESGTWEKTGSKLIFTADSTGESSEYTIKTLTSSSLILTADESAMDLGNDFPPNSTFEVTITLNR